MTVSIPPIVLIGGPTASGKSALAFALAQQLGRAVIINADALQVYRPLRVLTARPTAAEEAVVPHRLYGYLEGSVRGSVAEWLTHAHEEIRTALEAGLVPLVVGGSGMYLHAFLHGLSPVPEIPAEIRHEAITQHGLLGGVGFQAALAALDPVGAAKLPPGDTQRLVRAYEVVRATGRPLHEWQRELMLAPDAGWNIQSFVLEPERSWLYGRCDGRFLAMLAAGAEDEVRALLALQLPPAAPVMKAVGVVELADYFAGRLTLSQATARAQQATRNYAKRQLTWFRNQLPEAVRLLPLAGRPLNEQAQELAGLIRH